MEKEKSKSKRLTITFPQDTYATLQEFADEWEISLSEVVRLAVSGNLERYLGNVRYVNTRDAHVIVNNQFIINENIGKVFTEIQGMKNELRRIGINYNQEVKLLHIQRKKEAYKKKMARLPSSFGSARYSELEKLDNEEAAVKAATSKFDQDAVIKLLRQFDKSAEKVGDVLCRFQK